MRVNEPWYTRVPDSCWRCSQGAGAYLPGSQLRVWDPILVSWTPCLVVCQGSARGVLSPIWSFGHLGLCLLPATEQDLLLPGCWWWSARCAPTPWPLRSGSCPRATSWLRTGRRTTWCSGTSGPSASQVHLQMHIAMAHTRNSKRSNRKGAVAVKGAVQVKAALPVKVAETVGARHQDTGYRLRLYEPHFQATALAWRQGETLICGPCPLASRVSPGSRCLLWLCREQAGEGVRAGPHHSQQERGLRRQPAPSPPGVSALVRARSCRTLCIQLLLAASKEEAECGQTHMHWHRRRSMPFVAFT